MPWTGEDFLKFSKGLTLGQAAQAAALANKIFRSCLSRGGLSEECEKVAIATALARVKDRRSSMADGVGQERDGKTEAKYTLKPWDGSFSRFSVEQLLRSVPKAIADWAKRKAKEKGRDVIKDDLRLPYKEPDGTINIRAVRNALARLSQVTGVPKDVLDDAREELQSVLDAYHKAKGEAQWVQGIVQVTKPVSEALVPGPNGTVLVNMTLCRAGLWDFSDQYESYYVALESPEDVFSSEFIQQWKGLPIILDHEPGEWVDRSNISQKIVGVVLGAERSEDGNFLVGQGVLWKTEAIQAINEGIVELSKGYACDVLDEEGVWPENGELKKYNKIHTNFQLNHVAIVSKGRCGGPCRIVTQAVKCKQRDDNYAQSGSCPCGKQVNGEDVMTELKFSLGGKEFVITSPEGAKLFQEALDKHLENLEKAKAVQAESSGKDEAAPTREEEKARVQAESELAQAKERLVALEAEAKVYRSKCEEFEKRVKALESGEALQGLVTERLELVRKAEEKIPNVDWSKKTNREIRVEVIKTFDKDFNDKDRSDSEIKAIYEAMLRAEASLKADMVKAVGVTDEAKPDIAKRLAEARERSRGRSARLPKADQASAPAK